LKKQSASILLQARGILSTLIIAELFADAIWVKVEGYVT
jgi:hypothetical protein